jgi:hypothetical protein
MVAAKLNAFKFAKATDSVVAYQTADAKADLQTSDNARKARAFTLLVACTATEQSVSAKKSDD